MLKDSDEANSYDLISKTHNRRLKPGLPQDILLTDTEEYSLLAYTDQYYYYYLLRYIINIL